MERTILLILPFLLVLFRQNQLIGAIFLVALLIHNKKSQFTIYVSATSLLIFFLSPFYIIFTMETSSLFIKILLNQEHIT